MTLDATYLWRERLAILAQALLKDLKAKPCKLIIVSPALYLHLGQFLDPRCTDRGLLLLGYLGELGGVPLLQNRQVGEEKGYYLIGSDTETVEESFWERDW